jgi:hypothetical protein
LRRSVWFFDLGTEAETLRKALFVIALIGLSFGAGAAVNGSAPGWARAWIQGGRSKDAPVDEVEPPAVGDTSPAETIPAAPLPPLSADSPDSSKAETPPPAQPSASAEPPDLSPPPAPRDEAPALAPPGTDDNPKPQPEADPAVKAAEGPPALDKPVDVPAPPPPSAPTPPSSTEPAPQAQEGSGWADAPGSAPAAAVVPGRPKVDPAITKAAHANPAPAGTWADVRRRLRELGASRYWLEGEPGGLARFRCVIPLAGQRAVAQQFEGEGDDDLQAAEIALRRIVLWRATQPH